MDLVHERCAGMDVSKLRREGVRPGRRPRTSQDGGDVVDVGLDHERGAAAAEHLVASGSPWW